jgi:hypothetical protein
MGISAPLAALILSTAVAMAAFAPHPEYAYGKILLV